MSFDPKALWSRPAEHNNNNNNKNIVSLRGGKLYIDGKPVVRLENTHVFDQAVIPLQRSEEGGEKMTDPVPAPSCVPPAHTDEAPSTAAVQHAGKVSGDAASFVRQRCFAVLGCQTAENEDLIRSIRETYLAELDKAATRAVPPNSRWQVTSRIVPCHVKKDEEPYDVVLLDGGILHQGGTISFDPSVIVGTDAFILTYSVHNRGSFDFVQRLHDKLTHILAPTPYVLVGTASLTGPTRVVLNDEAEKLSAAWGCKAFTVTESSGASNVIKGIVDDLIDACNLFWEYHVPAADAMSRRSPWEGDAVDSSQRFLASSNGATPLTDGTGKDFTDRAAAAALKAKKCAVS